MLLSGRSARLIGLSSPEPGRSRATPPSPNGYEGAACKVSNLLLAMTVSLISPRDECRAARPSVRPRLLPLRHRHRTTTTFPSLPSTFVPLRAASEAAVRHAPRSVPRYIHGAHPRGDPRRPAARSAPAHPPHPPDIPRVRIIVACDLPAETETEDDPSLLARLGGRVPPFWHRRRVPISAWGGLVECLRSSDVAQGIARSDPSRPEPPCGDNLVPSGRFDQHARHVVHRAMRRARGSAHTPRSRGYQHPVVVHDPDIPIPVCPASSHSSPHECWRPRRRAEDV
jgi:hypothetical protein